MIYHKRNATRYKRKNDSLSTPPIPSLPPGQDCYDNNESVLVRVLEFSYSEDWGVVSAINCDEGDNCMKYGRNFNRTKLL